MFSDSSHCLHRLKPDGAGHFLTILECPEHAETTDCSRHSVFYETVGLTEKYEQMITE